MFVINWDEIVQNNSLLHTDHKRKEEILEELKLEPVDEKLRRCK